MHYQWYGIVEMLLSFGVILGLGIWQLISLNRHAKSGDGDKTDRRQSHSDEPKA
jgi:hypothetical protein